MENFTHDEKYTAFLADLNEQFKAAMALDTQSGVVQMVRITKF